MYSVGRKAITPDKGNDTPMGKTIKCMPKQLILRGASMPRLALASHTGWRGYRFGIFYGAQNASFQAFAGKKMEYG